LDKSELKLARWDMPDDQCVMWDFCVGSRVAGLSAAKRQHHAREDSEQRACGPPADAGERM